MPCFGRSVFDLFLASVAFINFCLLTYLRALGTQPPPARRNGAQAKIYYCNQVSVRPPTIVGAFWICPCYVLCERRFC